MNGKSKCKILKEIRKEIARANNIEFVTAECKYKGECLGTCPKCEEEVRFLNSELAKLKQAGKVVAVAGLAAAVMATSVACVGADDADAQSSSTPSKFQNYEITTGAMPYRSDDYDKSSNDESETQIGETPNSADE